MRESMFRSVRAGLRVSSARRSTFPKPPLYRVDIRHSPWSPHTTREPKNKGFERHDILRFMNHRCRQVGRPYPILAVAMFFWLVLRLLLRACTASFRSRGSSKVPSVGMGSNMLPIWA